MQKNKTFIIINKDILYDISYNTIHETKHVLVLRPVEELSEGIISEINRGLLANCKRLNLIIQLHGNKTIKPFLNPVLTIMYMIGSTKILLVAFSILIPYQFYIVAVYVSCIICLFQKNDK